MFVAGLIRDYGYSASSSASLSRMQFLTCFRSFRVFYCRCSNLIYRRLAAAARAECVAPSRDSPSIADGMNNYSIRPKFHSTVQDLLQHLHRVFCPLRCFERTDFFILYFGFFVKDMNIDLFRCRLCRLTGATAKCQRKKNSKTLHRFIPYQEQPPSAAIPCSSRPRSLAPKARSCCPPGP